MIALGAFLSLLTLSSKKRKIASPFLAQEQKAKKSVSARFPRKQKMKKKLTICCVKWTPVPFVSHLLTKFAEDCFLRAVIWSINLEANTVFIEVFSPKIARKINCRRQQFFQRIPSQFDFFQPSLLGQITAPDYGPKARQRPKKIKSAQRPRKSVLHFCLNFLQHALKSAL